MKHLIRALIGLSGLVVLAPFAQADSFSISYSQGYPHYAAPVNHYTYVEHHPRYVTVRGDDRHEHDRGRGHREHGRGHGYGHDGHHDRDRHGHHGRHHQPHYRPHHQQHHRYQHGHRDGHHQGSNRIEGVYVNPRLFR